MELKDDEADSLQSCKKASFFKRQDLLKALVTTTYGKDTHCLLGRRTQ